MNHFMTLMDSIIKFGFSFLVPFSYFNALLSFPQSYLYGFLTLVVRKDTTVWMSPLTQELRNNN